MSLGNALLPLGRLTEAEAVYSECVSVRVTRADEHITMASRLGLAEVLVEMGKGQQALGHAWVARRLLVPRPNIECLSQVEYHYFLMLLAGVLASQGRMDDLAELLQIAGSLELDSRLCGTRARITERVLSSKISLAARPDAEIAAHAERRLGPLLRHYQYVLEQGALLSDFGVKAFLPLLAELARVETLLGREEEAVLLDQEAADIQALLRAMSDGELRTELQEARAAGAGGGHGGRTKLTRK